jgi:hypothetical protein
MFLLLLLLLLLMLLLLSSLLGYYLFVPSIHTARAVSQYLACPLHCPIPVQMDTHRTLLHHRPFMMMIRRIHIILARIILGMPRLFIMAKVSLPTFQLAFQLFSWSHDRIFICVSLAVF